MKRFLQIVVAIITLIIVAMISLLIFINPNDYKDEMQAEAKKALNRELVIAGDLSWSFFPRLSIGTTNVSVKNPAGYNRENLMKIGSVSASIAILPLFKGELELGKLSLHGLRLNIITKASGVSNLDTIGPVRSKYASKPIPSDKTPASSVDEPATLPDNIRFAGLEIIDAQLEVQDLATKVTTTIDIAEISLDEFELGQASNFTLLMVMATAGIEGNLAINGKLTLSKDLKQLMVKQFKLSSELSGDSIPSGKIAVAVNADINVGLDNKKIVIDNLLLKANDIELSGKATIELATKTKVRFSLLGNEWDLNPFMPASSEEQPIPEVANQPQIEPNLEFLNTLDILGDITIAGVKASGVTINQINLNVAVNKGIAKIAPLNVN